MSFFKMLNDVIDTLNVKEKLKEAVQSSVEYRNQKNEFSYKSDDELLNIFKNTYHSDKQTACAAFTILKNERGFSPEKIRKITGL